jgi:hypothetical protein
MKRWSLLLALAGCSHAVANHDVDANGTGVDAAGGDATGGLDAALVDAADTCPPPTGAFSRDLPPGPGTDTTRSHAILQVTPSGPRVLVSDYYANGSFFDANLNALARTAPNTWAKSSVADGGIAFSIARELAATGGSDPCIAYSNDYDGSLHLRCSSTSDRTLAPGVESTLAMTASGTTKHLVYGNASGALVYQTFDASPGPVETIDASAWTIAETQIAADAGGDIHVAYISYPVPQTGETTHKRTIYHAVRHAGAWTRELVVADQYTTGTAESTNGLALVIDGAPTIAYHGRSDRSLRLARRDSAGNWSSAVLVAADPGFPNDDVGAGVALQSDCAGRVHVVYQRNLSTDNHPNVQLAYARIDGANLIDGSLLPPYGSDVGYVAVPFSLGFVVGADGNQYVSAQVASVGVSAVYYVQR